MANVSAASQSERGGAAGERVLGVTVRSPIDLPYVARRMGRPAGADPVRPATPGQRQAA